MIDKSVVFRKLTSLREHVTRIRRRRTHDLESFKLDTDRQDAIGMSLLVAVQDALDIALHMASDEGWGVAASYADGFGILANNGVIDPALAAALANLATLRNRLAHGYGTVHGAHLGQSAGRPGRVGCLCLGDRSAHGGRLTRSRPIFRSCA
jgi:uncharacterized protein YutE (UPF0331/DUF86 family)